MHIEAGYTQRQINDLVGDTPHDARFDIYNFAIVENTAYVPFLDTNPPFGDPDTRIQPFRWDSFERVPQLPDILRGRKALYGFSPKEDGFYLGDRTENKIVDLTSAYDPFPDDDIDLPTSFAGKLVSIAWNELTLVALSSDLEVSLYGSVPTPPPTPPEIRTQYSGFSKFQERFDIVSIGSGNQTTEHKATNIEAPRHTNTAGFSVSSNVELQDQLSSIRFIPKQSLLNIDVGNIIFLHSGRADARPTQVASQRWEIKGIEYAGNEETQVFICSLITE